MAEVEMRLFTIIDLSVTDGHWTAMWTDRWINRCVTNGRTDESMDGQMDDQAKITACIL